MARRPGFIRDEFFLVLGALVVVIAGLGFMGLATADGPRGGARGAAILLGSIMAMGLTLLTLGVYFKGYERRLRRLLELLRSLDNITVLGIASASGQTPEQVRQGVVYLISNGFVALHFDPESDRVISPRAGGGRWLSLPGTCPHCSAPSPSMVLEGDPTRCEYCDHSLPVQPVTDERAKTEAGRTAATRSAAQLNRQSFSGNPATLILLWLVCWPLGLYYLLKHVSRPAPAKR